MRSLRRFERILCGRPSIGEEFDFAEPMDELVDRDQHRGVLPERSGPTVVAGSVEAQREQAVSVAGSRRQVGAKEIASSIGTFDGAIGMPHYDIAVEREEFDMGGQPIGERAPFERGDEVDGVGQLIGSQHGPGRADPGGALVKGIHGFLGEYRLVDELGGVELAALLGQRPEHE